MHLESSGTEAEVAADAAGVAVRLQATADRALSCETKALRDASAESAASALAVTVPRHGMQRSSWGRRASHDREAVRAEVREGREHRRRRMVSRVVSVPTGDRSPPILPSPRPHQTRKQRQLTVITRMLRTGI